MTESASCVSAVLSAATIQVDEGHDVLLPCRLDPEADVSESPVTWSKDEARNVVHAHVRGHDLPRDQKDEFRNRTRLDHGALRKGDASLRLFSVRPSDSGDYSCYIQRLDRLIPSVLRVGEKGRRRGLLSSDTVHAQGFVFSLCGTVRRNQTSRTTAMMSPLDDVTEAPGDHGRHTHTVNKKPLSLYITPRVDKEEEYDIKASNYPVNDESMSEIHTHSPAICTEYTAGPVVCVSV